MRTNLISEDLIELYNDDGNVLSVTDITLETVQSLDCPFNSDIKVTISGLALCVDIAQLAAARKDKRKVLRLTVEDIK